MASSALRMNLLHKRASMTTIEACARNGSERIAMAIGATGTHACTTSKNTIRVRTSLLPTSRRNGYKASRTTWIVRRLPGSTIQESATRASRCQETKVSYFNKLRACLNQAFEERIIPMTIRFYSYKSNPSVPSQKISCYSELSDLETIPSLPSF